MKLSNIKNFRFQDMYRANEKKVTVKIESKFHSLMLL